MIGNERVGHIVIGVEGVIVDASLSDTAHHPGVGVVVEIRRAEMKNGAKPMTLCHGRAPLHLGAALGGAGLLSFTGDRDHVDQVQRFAERSATPRDIDLDGVESYLFQRFERRISPLDLLFGVAQDGHTNFRNGSGLSGERLCARRLYFCVNTESRKRGRARGRPAEKGSAAD